MPDELRCGIRTATDRIPLVYKFRSVRNRLPEFEMVNQLYATKHLANDIDCTNFYLNIFDGKKEFYLITLI